MWTWIIGITGIGAFYLAWADRQKHDAERAEDLERERRKDAAQDAVIAEQRLALERAASAAAELADNKAAERAASQAIEQAYKTMGVLVPPVQKPE
jgi:hypothetical protein